MSSILVARLDNLLDLLDTHRVESAYVRGDIVYGVDEPTDEIELVIKGGPTGLDHYGTIDDIETVLATPVTVIAPEMMRDGEEVVQLTRAGE